MTSRLHVAQAVLFLFALLPPLPSSATIETVPFGIGSSASAGNSSTVCPPCGEFDRLNSLVRDGRIPRVEAQRELSSLLPALNDFYYRNVGRTFRDSDWVFPLRGYGAGAIGGGKRHGYQPRGYDWFDGNRHKGHPSFDIFIRDRNRDDRDDRTGSFVQVLSLTGGIVVARETGWKPGSGLRGGNYLWIWDPVSQALVYYAHNRELLVDLGTIVRPGDPIALVGRTGLNAYRKRSPTHLHITCLEWRNGSFVPRNIYFQLRKCKTRTPH